MIWIAAFGISGLLIDVFKIKSIRHRFMYYMLYLIFAIIIVNLVE